MSRIERTENKEFDCDVLGGIALIQITRRSFQLGEMGARTPERVEFRDCANKDECGIAFHPNPHSTHYKWKCCPAHPHYDPSEPLPSSQ
jgi:hypothetical protein